MFYLYSFNFSLQFDISKIKVNSGKLMPKRLLEFNKLEISNLLNNEKNHKFIIEKVKRIVLEAFPERYVFFYMYSILFCCQRILLYS